MPAARPGLPTIGQDDRNPMPTKPNRNRTAVLATAVALALTASLGGAAAVPPTDGPGDTRRAPHEPPGADGAHETLTLITGDTVILGPDGGVLGVAKGEGRENIPVRVTDDGASTLILPLDAALLVEEGRVDRRLFDVAELTRAEYGSFDGTPLIVTYEHGDGNGNDDAADTLRAGSGAEVRAEFGLLGAEALTVPDEGAAALWETFTASADDGLGVASLALDGVNHVNLDESTVQVGAPDAWGAGYDGTGVTIAVVDTGLDAAHGDFDGRVVATENFTTTRDPGDRHGHGTHVASIAAGSGDRSDGTYRGVAPGADLLAAKTMDNQGYGIDSWIIAGMEWAVEQGADIVNLSVGGIPTPGLDPKSDALDRLAADSDTLFVVAAGNRGPDAGTLDSPAVADAALAVGSVTKSDELATSSSIGPRLEDGALKPDVAAPGVEIGAAAAAGSFLAEGREPVADGYFGLSGTSMAAPHVVGAAAILLQRDPGLTGEQLKDLLVSSAVGLDSYAPTQQGAGRLDITRALEQTITADTGTLTYGVAPYPQGDAEPVTREITYRNHGDSEITLDLATATTGPEGGTAPDGMFTLDADRVTIPAGGSGSVAVTADPRSGAELTGSYGLFVTASADGQTVRTAGALELEQASHDLTIRVTGRDGQPADALAGSVRVPAGWGEGGQQEFASDGGEVTLRVAPGEYALEAAAFGGSPTEGDVTGADWLALPRVTVDRDTLVELDASDAEPLDFTVHDPQAPLSGVAGNLRIATGGSTTQIGWDFGAPAEGVGTAQAGPDVDGTALSATFDATHAHQDLSQSYHAHRAVADGFPTGLSHHLTAGDVATTTLRAGAPGGDRDGWIMTHTGRGVTPVAPLTLPHTSARHVQADGTGWEHVLAQLDDGEDAPAVFGTDSWRPSPGETTTETVNVGVFGPRMRAGDGATHWGDNLSLSGSLLADGRGHGGNAAYDSASSRLYFDGELYESWDEPLTYLWTEPPAGESEARLVSTVDRAARGYTNVSTTVTLDWSFTLPEPSDLPEGGAVPGPSTIRFTPELELDSTAPAGREHRVPVSVEGTAAASLEIEISYDGGENWAAVPLLDAPLPHIVADNPAVGGSVSLRATAEDTDGNTTVQTIIDAYRTR